MKYLLLRLLPKNLLSRLAGILAETKITPPVLSSFIRLYCHIYKINTDEMKLPLEKMKTFNEFFTRELKPNARPIDNDPVSVISPVDGAVAEYGTIENGLLIQTKGILYSLFDLVGKKDAIRFNGGYFITLYLSPADYHRIHSPITGKVTAFSYFSGNLWPVNQLGVENVGGLLSLNERIVTLLENSEKRTVAMVKVGALIVGKIKVNYNELSSNSKRHTQIHLPVVPAKTFKKGEEIGRFQLGSTVVLLFEKDSFQPVNLLRNKKIKLGEVIGRFATK